MTEPAPAAGPQRLGLLDGLRGIAACVVAFGYHARLLFVQGAFAGAGPVVGWFHAWGWTFVDLFFLISGYIFAHVYLPGGTLAQPGGARRFVAARVARLYPLHLVMLCLMATLFSAKPGNDPANFVAHLAMLQAFTRPFADTFDGPSWSITIECLCYLVFMVAVRSGGRGLALVTGGAIVWGALVLVLAGSDSVGWTQFLLGRGLLGFFLGQALWHGRAQLARVPGWLLAALLAAGLLVPAGPVHPLLPLALLAWPAALVLGLRAQWLERPAMLWLGDRSYAIYLIHMPLFEFTAKYLGLGRGGLPGILAIHLVLAAVVLAYADAAYRRIERPARRALGAWLGAGRTVPLPA